MKNPFVSRELYERVLLELEECKQERKALTERLLTQGNGLSAVEALAEVLPNPASPEAESLVDKTTGALTISGLRQMAQDAAYKRAGRG